MERTVCKESERGGGDSQKVTLERRGEANRNKEEMIRDQTTVQG